MKIVQTLVLLLAIADGKKQAGHQKIKKLADVTSEKGQDRLSHEESANQKYDKYTNEMKHKQDILDEQEAKKHTLIGDLYTKTTVAITSAPLVGDAINTTHGLFKKTIGGVQQVGQKIGLQKSEADHNGVKTQQWYQTKEFKKFRNNSIIVSILLFVIGALSYGFYKLAWPLLHHSNSQYGEQQDTKDIETTGNLEMSGRNNRKMFAGKAGFGSTAGSNSLQIPKDIKFGDNVGSPGKSDSTKYTLGQHSRDPSSKFQSPNTSGRQSQLKLGNRK